MEKASKLRLTARQKKLKKLVGRKIAGMSKRDKLKAMTPKGVQKIVDEATAELDEMEANNG